MMNSQRYDSKSSYTAVEEYLEHITGELERFDLLPVHVIHLFLSTAIPEIQKKVAPTDSDLLKYLKSCPDLFEINNMFEVSYSKSSKMRSIDRRNGSPIPQKIENGRGHISRLFAAYGFISVSHPFRTSVYFSSRIFNKSYEMMPLDQSEYKINHFVGFDAEFGSSGNSGTPYRATKVWRVCEEEEEDEEEEDDDCHSSNSLLSKASSRSHNSSRSRNYYQKDKKHSSFSNHNIIEQKVFYSRNGKQAKSQTPQMKPDNTKSQAHPSKPDTFKSQAQQSKSDNTKSQAQQPKSDSAKPPMSSKPQSSTKKVKNAAEIKAEGNINNLFMNYGFITSKENKTDKIFFILKVVKCLKNMYDLRHTLNIGDVVKFTAVPSSKKDSKVMWEATSVILKDDYLQHEETSSSDEGSSEESLIPLKAKKEICKEVPLQASNSKLSEEDNCIKNRQGKIYPQSDSSALIKFGLKYSDDANADTCKFYMDGVRVSDVRWEFHDGDFVYFDAFKLPSKKMWTVSLVWQGDKPEQADVESETEGEETDSEISQENQEPHDVESNLDVSIASDENPSVTNFFNVTKTANWGDSPFPDEQAVDGSSPRDSESHYSSTESHLSTCETTTQRNEKVETYNEPVPRNNLNKHNSHKQSHDNPRRFVNGKDHNIRDGINSSTVKSNDHKIVNDKMNRIDDESHNYRMQKTSERTDNLVVNANVSGNQNVNSHIDLSASANTIKENGVMDTENSAYIKSEKKFRRRNDLDERSNQNNETKSTAHTLRDKKSDVVEIAVKSAGVKLFENLEGKIVKIYRIHIDVECSELNKRIALIWNDLYYDGVLIREKCKDLKELLKPEDKLSLNFFEITDDHGLAFRKVTLAWIGEKPKSIKEMEPGDFIETQNLEVSCKIPSRKELITSLRKQSTVDSKTTSNIVPDVELGKNDDESLRRLNQPTIENADDETGARKKSFLSTLFSSRSDNEVQNLNIHSDASAGHKLPNIGTEFMTPVDVSTILFNRVQQVKQTLHDPALCEKVIYLLERDLKSAVKILQPRLLSASSLSEIERTSLVDGSCQTNENLLLPLDSEVRRTLEKHPESEVVTSAVQTIITGDIIATGVFPH